MDGDIDLDYATDALLASLHIDLFLVQRARGWPLSRIEQGVRRLLQHVAARGSRRSPAGRCRL